MTVNVNSFEAWNLIHGPSASNWKSITFGNNLFLAISSEGNIITSSDCKTWTQRTLPLSATWTTVCYGNNTYIIGSANGIILYSFDGINWTQATTTVNPPINDICYAENQFIAISTGGKLLTSQNGLIWVEQNPLAVASWKTITYGNGKYIAVAYGSNLAAYSTNGTDWNQVELPFVDNWVDIAYGNGVYLIISFTSSRALISSDGITWIEIGTPVGTNSGWTSICYNNERFILMSITETIGWSSSISSNNIEWGYIGTGTSSINNWVSIIFGDGVYVAVGAYNSEILVFPPSYLSIYSGEDIDENINKIINYDSSMYSWEYKNSSDSEPFNLNDLLTDGNYIVDHYINGITGVNITPIKIIVREINSKILQWVLIERYSYTRYYDTQTLDFTNWEIPAGSTPIYRGNILPNHDIYKVWIDTSYSSPSLKVYNNDLGWVSTTISAAYADIEIYDKNNKKIDAFKYVNSKIKTDLDEFLSTFESHQLDTIAHVSIIEKTGFNNKLSSTTFNTMKVTALNELKTYTDSQLTEGNINLNIIKNDETQLNLTINDHVNNTVVHLNAQQVSEFNLKAETDHQHINNNSVKIDANDITSGVLPISTIPPEAIDLLITVTTNVARLALTKSQVQKGDCVHVLEDDYWYRVVDDTKLNSDDGYKPFKSDEMTMVEWDNVINHPTTLNGYGITDVYDKTEFEYELQIQSSIATKVATDNKLIELDESFSNGGATTTINVIDVPDLNNTKLMDIAYGNGMYIAVGTTYKFYRSFDGIRWLAANAPENQMISSITYGNNLFAVLSSNKTVSISPNGLEWTTHSVNFSFVKITHTNNKFFLIGTNYISISVDGITWSTTELTGSWTNIIYGNGIYVLIGNKIVSTSNDCITWVSHTISDGSWRNICYGNGKFVVSSISPSTPSSVVISTDGITWTPVDIVNSSWYNITYKDGKFYLLSNTNLMTSSDGITWTSIVSNANSWRSMAWNDNTGVIVGGTTSVLGKIIICKSILMPSGRLYDIINTQQNKFISALNDIPNIIHGAIDKEDYGIYIDASLFGAIVYSMTYGNGVFVAGCVNGLQYSYDGMVWNLSNCPCYEAPILNFKSIAYGNSVFIAFHNNNTYPYAFRSIDGINWELIKLPVTASWTRVYYGNGKFVAISSTSQYSIYSTDGLTWQTSLLPYITSWNSLCYGDNKFITISSDNYGRIAYSMDGIVWQTASLPSGLIAYNWVSIAYGNGLFVAITSSTTFATSPDGFTWTKRTLPVSVTYTDIVFDTYHLQFVISSASYAVWVSSDGITYTSANNPSSPSNCYIACGNGKTVLGNMSGYFWTTIDTSSTSNWKLSHSNWPNIAYNINFVNGKFFIVGKFSGFCISENGFNWRVCDIASPLSWYGVTYGNGIYVAMSTSPNKCATSSDSITWTLRTLPVSASYKSITFYKGKFILVAAGSSTGLYSSDGITWSTMTLPVSCPGEYITLAQDMLYIFPTSTSLNYLRSSNGTTWEQLSLASSKAFTKVIYSQDSNKNGGRFIQVSTSGIKLSYSQIDRPDLEWSEVVSSSGPAYPCIEYGSDTGIIAAFTNSALIKICLNPITSPDQWIDIATPQTGIGYNYVAYGNGRFIAIGSASREIIVITCTKDASIEAQTIAGNAHANRLDVYNDFITSYKTIIGI